MCYYKDMMLGFLQLQFDKNSKVLALLTALLRLNHSLENLQFVCQSTPITMGASIFFLVIKQDQENGQLHVPWSSEAC